MLNFLIISFSFCISAILSVLIFKKTSNKWISMLAAFFSNTLILVATAWILYSMDDEAKIFGFGHSGNYVFIFAIPFISWINFLLLQFQKIRK